MTAALSGANASSFTLTGGSLASITTNGGTRTFTVRPNAGLAAGTYTATITVSGTGLTSRTSTVNFTVTAAPSISVGPAGATTFTSIAAGYAAADRPAAQTFTVSNTGTVATGAMTVALSGANAASFTLSATSLASLAVGDVTRTFTVRPNAGLAAGTYTATVTVSGTGFTAITRTVSFTVTAAALSITLTPTGSTSAPHIFPGATAGYGAQATQEFTVRNTSTVATPAMTVALGGANASSFTLSATSLTSIATANGTRTFTVRPNTGLAAGTYNATVTVSGTGLTSQVTNIRFVVTAASTTPGAIEIIFDQNYSGAPAATRRALPAADLGNIMMPMPYPTRSGNWVFGGWFTSQAEATAVSNPPSRGTSDTSTMTGRPGTNTNSRVIPGSAGNTFTQTTTVYAGWIPVTPITVRNNVSGILVRGGDGNGLNASANRTVTANRIDGIPPAFQENFDWLRFIRHDTGTPGNDGTQGRPELVWFNANGTLRHRNSVFDMIWEGNGTVNWAVRWESGRTITRAERERMARMLHESVNIWSRELIGMPGWPFGEIEVHVVGYAMNADRMEGRRANEVLWINNTHEGPNGIHPGENRMASAPRAMSRFLNFGGRPTASYTYPGGLHNRFDMYQWVTQGFTGAVGGDWGNRLGDTRIVGSGGTNQGYASGVNAQGVNTLNGVQTHEVGHSYGFYDLYGTLGRCPPPTSVLCPGGQTRFRQGQLRTVMDGTYNGPLNNYDIWMMRYHWDWLYSQRMSSVNNRPFARSTQAF